MEMLIPEDSFPLLNLKYANCLVKPLRLIKMLKTWIEVSHASYRKMGKPVYWYSSRYWGEGVDNCQILLQTHLISGLGMHSFQKKATFLRSFAFFLKERDILCILYKRMQRSLRSFAFFIKERSVLCVLYKRTQRSLHSFTFFIKERGVLCVLLLSL